MRRLGAATITLVTVLFVQLIATAGPAAALVSIDPNIVPNIEFNDLFLQTELRLAPSAILEPTGGTLVVGESGTLFNSGTILGDVNIQQGGTLKLDLSGVEPPLLTVTGSVTIGSGASLVALGVMPRPGPVPIGDEWSRYLALDHDYYMASGGTFVRLPDGSNALGGMPRPPLPPIGDEAAGLLASLITMGDGSTLNFDFDFASASYGDSFIFGSSGFSLAEGASVMTNLPSGWVMMNSLPMVINLNGAPVPEPSTFILFGVGLAGLAGLRYRRNRAGK